MRVGNRSIDPIGAAAAVIVALVALAFPLAALGLAVVGFWSISRSLEPDDEGTA